MSVYLTRIMVIAFHYFYHKTKNLVVITFTKKVHEFNFVLEHHYVIFVMWFFCFKRKGGC